LLSNIQHKLRYVLDFILIEKEKDKLGYWISRGLVLSFGIISISNSIFLIFLTFFASYGLTITELLLRVFLAGIFLTVGLGLILFLRSPRRDEEDEFWVALENMHSCLSAERNLSSEDILLIKEQIGIRLEAEQKQT
jgi:hypothetical protein